jgi:hypothetical protein
MANNLIKKYQSVLKEMRLIIAKLIKERDDERL